MLVESGIRKNSAYGIWNPGFWNLDTAQGGIHVLLTNTGNQYLESRIHSVESRIQNCPFPYMGRSVYFRPAFLVQVIGIGAGARAPVPYISYTAIVDAKGIGFDPV